MPTRQELLTHLWREVINVHMNAASLQAEIERAKARPNDPFADAGQALERLLTTGADPHDICLVRRAAAYGATFSTLYALGDPGVGDENVLMLFEELLTSDPTGMEGRPGSADAA